MTRISLFCCLLAAAALPRAGAQTQLQGTDIGATATGGSTRFDPASGEYRVTGGGENMWGVADAFQFASQPLSGDFNLEADIRFEGEGGAPHRKAGLVVRQNLDPGAPYADIAVHGDGLTALQFRTTAGGPTQEVRSQRTAPTHIRLERRGDKFTVYAGNSAADMVSTGPVTVALQDPVQAGLAVCSHQAGQLETAVFSNVRIEPVAASPQPAVRYRSKISILRLSDKSVRSIFTGDGVYEAPNWSRDGKHLLINSGGRLLRLPVEGGTPEPLNLDASLRCNNDHDYSADGKMLAFSASSPSSRQSQVYVADADGSNARLLVSAAPSYFHGWAPDGKVLSFVGQRNGNFDLFRIPVTGGTEEHLTTHTGYDDGPDYSPDGRWIYFNSDRSGGWDIWRIPATGAGPDDKLAQQVTNDGMEDWFPHPSPDGKWLLIFSFPEGTKGHNGRLPGVHLRLMALPGDKLTPAKPEVIHTFFGGQGSINVNSWSPDSSQFAFVTYEPDTSGTN